MITSRAVTYRIFFLRKRPIFLMPVQHVLSCHLMQVQWYNFMQEKLQMHRRDIIFCIIFCTSKSGFRYVIHISWIRILICCLWLKIFSQLLCPSRKIFRNIMVYKATYTYWQFYSILEDLLLWWHLYTVELESRKNVIFLLAWLLREVCGG